MVYNNNNNTLTPPPVLNVLQEQAAQVVQAERRFKRQPDVPLDERRYPLISRAKKLYSRLLLELPLPDLQAKLTSLLYETMQIIYDADSTEDLDTAEFNLELIEANLANYKELKDRQYRARNQAMAVSVIAIVGLISMIILVGSREPGFDSGDLIPVIDIPWSVLIWSFIGSMTAILYRFNLQSDVELQDPFRWLYTRPITGIVMGIVLYLALQIGFISLSVDAGVNIGGIELVWIAAFIGGFSDRLADSILQLLVGRFGGDGEASPLGSVSSVQGFNAVDPTLMANLSTAKTQTGSDPDPDPVVNVTVNPSSATTSSPAINGTANGAGQATVENPQREGV